MSTNDKNFDIIPMMVPFFDVHLLVPLLDFLREIQIYDPKSITIQKIRAVEKTNLVEAIEDEYESYKNDEVLQKEYLARKDNLTARKDAIYSKINNEPEWIQNMSTFFKDTELITNLKTSINFNIGYLSNHYDISYEKLEEYYVFAKFKYECGIYDEAEQMLGNYLLVIQSIPNHQLKSYQSALWGRLACRILQAKWSEALNDFTAVKESIEARGNLPLDQLRQRGWLLHKALFVFLLQRDGVESLIDLFSERFYLQTVENLCPWLLRYYTVAIILSPSRRRSLLKDVLREIRSLSYLYSDPVTEFLSSLFDSFDFDIAQVKLGECMKLMKNDFFLKVHLEKFMHEARMLICEMYCTVHRTVDIVMLAEKLQLTHEEAEKWMVDMVRGSSSPAASSSAVAGAGTPAAVSASSSISISLNAKIDSFGKQVIIAPPVSTVHQQVVDATKELTTRTAVLSANLESLVKDNNSNGHSHNGGNSNSHKKRNAQRD